MSLGMERLFVNTMHYTASFVHSKHSTGEKLAATLGGTLTAIPLELLSAAENLLLKLPIHILSTAGKVSLYVLSVPCSLLFGRQAGSSMVRTARNMPGLVSVLFTAYKVVGFVFGTACTSSIGLFASTKLNYNIHTALGLLNEDLDCPLIQELIAKKGEISSLELTLVNVRGQVTGWEREAGRLTKEINSKEQSIRNLNAQKRTNEGIIQTRDRTIQSLNEQLTALSRQIRELEAKKQELERKLNQTANSNNSLRASLESDLAQCVTTISTLRIENHGLIVELQTARAELERTKTENVNQDRFKVQQLEELVIKLEMEKNVLAAANPGLDQVVEMKDNEIKELQKQIAALKQQIDQFVDIEESFRKSNVEAQDKLRQVSKQLQELSTSSEEDVTEAPPRNDEAFEKLKAKYKKLKELAKTQATEQEKVADSSEDLRKQIATLQNTNASLQDRIKTIQTEDDQAYFEQVEKLKTKESEIAQLQRQLQEKAHLEDDLQAANEDLTVLQREYNDLAKKQGIHYTMVRPSDYAMLHRSNTQ